MRAIASSAPNEITSPRHYLAPGNDMVLGTKLWYIMSELSKDLTVLVLASTNGDKRDYMLYKNVPKNSVKIFVVGGCGFIGSNFIRMMLTKHTDVSILNFDKLTYSGNPDNVRDLSKNSRYTFVKGDIVDQASIKKAFKAFKPDYVINFAAETHVDKSIHVGSKEFVLTNVMGVFNLLELVREFGVKKYVQVSTDEVYGQLPNPYDLKNPRERAKAWKQKFTESSPFAPNVPYSATKAGGDMLCRAYYSTWHVPVVVTHCSNNYGPYQYPEKIIPYFILRILEGKTLPMYGDGKNIRDWIYVLDHCEALKLCLFKGKPGEVYNIGADNEMTNLEIAALLLKHFGKDKSLLEFVPDRPGHDRRYAIDSKKIRTELGWKPRTNFKKAFKQTVEWYVSNPDWIDKVRKRTGVFNAHIDLWTEHKLTSSKVKTNKK